MRMKTLTRNDNCTPMFNAVSFTTAKTWKQCKCPWTEEWIKKMWCVPYTIKYSAIKREENLSFATTWMDLEVIMLSEISDIEKDK